MCLRRLHTLYFSSTGNIQDSFDTIKFKATEEQVNAILTLLKIFFTYDMYELYGPYVHENCDKSQSVKLIYKQNRISTPYGKVYIPSLAKENTFYIQTKDHDIALDLLEDGELALSLINYIEPIPFVKFRLNKKM